jgi:hypothetical protein
MSDLTLKQLMAATPESIAKIQYDALQAHALSVLDRVRDQIRTGVFKDVIDGCFYSSSGDDHGMDNTCINFTYTPEDEDADVMDIGDVCERLEELRVLAFKLRD